MTQAHPLDWPPSWPRTPNYDRQDGDKFKRGSLEKGYKRPDVDKTRNELIYELQHLGADNIVLSTNVELRQDGQPYARRRDPADPAIAVYFMLDGEQMVMAQDTYDRVADNIRSLTLAIAGMRQMQRHGGGTMLKRAFSGFTALPPPDAMTTPPPMHKQWWEVLGVTPDTPEVVWKAAYKALARTATESELYMLNAAKEAAAKAP